MPLYAKTALNFIKIAQRDPALRRGRNTAPSARHSLQTLAILLASAAFVVTAIMLIESLMANLFLSEVVAG